MSNREDPYKAPFLYTSKASRSERDDGLGHLYYKHVDKKPVRIDREEYEALEASGTSKVTSGCIHPTVKPVEVMEWLIERLSGEGDTILEPFGGSGTTGIAAINTGRNAHLVELDEDGVYEDIIKGRLRQGKINYLQELEVWESRPEIEIPEDADTDAELEPEEVGFGDLFG